MRHQRKAKAPTSECGSNFTDDDGAARYLNCKPRLLQTLRSRGGGPRFIRVGRDIRYRFDWLDQWVESNSVTSKAEERNRRAVTGADVAAFMEDA